MLHPVFDRRLRILLLAGAATLSFAPASAETLRDALTKAYATNPTLTGARAQQRANDENVPIARANGLPNVAATGQFSENVLRNAASFVAPIRQVNIALSASVPIYQGGQVRNSVRGADARVEAGVANLRDTEANVFSQVVAVYMDVIRDQAIVGLNRKQVSVLRTNLEATRDRFQVGDLTRTDVAQSQARLALQQSLLEQAEAQLIGSRERYIQLVGDVPGDLEPPPPLPNLPVSPDIAVKVAVESNPALAAAQRNRDAARFDTNAARSTRLPRISAVADGSYNNFLNTLGSPGIPNSNKSATLGIQARIPLFQGGGPSAQVRQGQARESQALEQVIAVERNVVQQTRSAYASWQSSVANITSQQTAVDANALSLEGVRAENSVGNRTILDILNAEQELLNSQVNLVTARRNAYVAGFSLLAAMGQAEARDLGLDGGALYDPTVNYRRVRGIIWDWDEDPRPTTVATRTVDTPAQTPDLIGPK